MFTPDISYTIGEPGPSAVEFVNSGVESLKKNSWVDAAHIGIQGQSWGGYQVAYLITQTNMYAAAWAGDAGDRTVPPTATRAQTRAGRSRRAVRWITGPGPRWSGTTARSSRTSR